MATVTATYNPVPPPSVASQVADYLGWFFSSGRSAPGRHVRVAKGLWDLLTWCLSLDRKARGSSPLARRLLQESSGGWRDENDLLEALSRDAKSHNASRLAPDDVAGFVRDLLHEGEQARASCPSLLVELEFELPRLREHPALSTVDLARALREDGLSWERLRYHLEAVHPERMPYMGAWMLSLHTAGRSFQKTRQPQGEQTIETLLDGAACGRRTHLSLALRHSTELAACFRLSIGAKASIP